MIFDAFCHSDANLGRQLDQTDAPVYVTICANITQHAWRFLACPAILSSFSASMTKPEWWLLHSSSFSSTSTEKINAWFQMGTSIWFPRRLWRSLLQYAAEVLRNFSRHVGLSILLINSSYEPVHSRAKYNAWIHLRDTWPLPPAGFHRTRIKTAKR